MNAWRTARCSVNGFTMAVVAKQNIKPKKIEIGSAGKALRQMARSSNVRHKPCKQRKCKFYVYSHRLYWKKKQKRSYDQNSHKAGERCIPIAIAGCLANQYGVEDEIAQTKFDATWKYEDKNWKSLYIKVLVVVTHVLRLHIDLNRVALAPLSPYDIPELDWHCLRYLLALQLDDVPYGPWTRPPIAVWIRHFHQAIVAGGFVYAAWRLALRHRHAVASFHSNRARPYTNTKS